MSPPGSSRAFDKCVAQGRRTFHKETLSASRSPMGMNFSVTSTCHISNIKGESTYFNMMVHRLTNHNQPNASPLEQKWSFRVTSRRICLSKCILTSHRTFISFKVDFYLSFGCISLQDEPVVCGEYPQPKKQHSYSAKSDIKAD